MSKMKKILMVGFLIMYTTNAYATFDYQTAVFTASEKFQNMKEKVLSVKQKIEQAKMDISEGWKNVQSCSSFNVKGCMAAGKSLQDLDGEYGDQLNTIFVLPETGLEKVEDKNSQEIIDGIRNAIYVAGEGDSLEAARNKLDANNAMLADDVATLFAKSTASRQRILKDGVKEASYQEIGADMELEKILKSKAEQRIDTITRIARIIELRAYMIGVPATSELTMYVKSASESK